MLDESSQFTEYAPSVYMIMTHGDDPETQDDWFEVVQVHSWNPQRVAGIYARRTGHFEMIDP